MIHGMLPPQDGMEADFGGDCYYKTLSSVDIMGRLKPLLLQNYVLREVDMKLILAPKLGIDTPWHHVYHDHHLDCQTWHHIMFDVLSRSLPAERCFVPSSCQQCWKVVVRPKTLVQLMALLEIEQKLGRPSKLGVETRPSVHGLYGGYFYNHSLQEGLECYEIVRQNVNDHPQMGPDVKILLKRACTEYERLAGPSDQWAISEEQVHLETMVNTWVVRDIKGIEQSIPMVTYVHKYWIEFAYSYGDETYKEFTNGKPLYKDYVTYQYILTLPEEEREKAFKHFERQVVYDYTP